MLNDSLGHVIDILSEVLELFGDCFASFFVGGFQKGFDEFGVSFCLGLGFFIDDFVLRLLLFVGILGTFGRICCGCLHAFCFFIGI